MPGFPVLHYLPEFAQTHGHSVSDGIQPPHPLPSPSPPAFNLSQYQGVKHYPILSVAAAWPSSLKSISILFMIMQWHKQTIVKSEDTGFI